MIAGEAEAGNAPARDITKFEGATGCKNFRQWSTAGVRGTENAADAGACNV